MIDRVRLEKLLEDYPTSIQKKNQLISDIRAENIYRKFPDFEGIIQKMVLKVLKYRDGNNVYSGWLIQEIKSKLILELIPPDAEKMCLEKTLELLKERWNIDLEKEREQEEKRAQKNLENLRLENLRLEAESEKHRKHYAELAKQREMKRIRDEKEAKIAADEIVKEVEPITIPLEKAKNMNTFLAELKHLEAEYYGGFKGPIAMDLLFDNLMRKKFPVEELADILKRLIRDAQIYETRPGHFNSA